MRKYIVSLIIIFLGLLAPERAHAQIDALIDLVVDAVEPTPVYDTGLREATENLGGLPLQDHVLRPL